MRLSNSKFKTYRRCPNKYRYKYKLKLRPKARQEGLEKGTWMHSLLQAFYEGKNWKKVHKKNTKWFAHLPDEIREDLGDMPQECLRLMRSYLRQYPNDLERYRVIDAEIDEIVTLPNGLKLQVIVDLIVEDRREGGLWPWDHKFRGKLAQAMDQLMDPQLTLYYRALEILGYKDLRGAMYNEVRTAVPKVPTLNKDGSLTKRKNIDTDVHTYMSAIKLHGLDPADYAEILTHIATNEEIRFFNRVHIPKDPPVIKTVMRDLIDTAGEIHRAEQADRYPRTTSKNCNWDCEYKDICLGEMHGGDALSLARTNFTVVERRPAKEER